MNTLSSWMKRGAQILGETDAVTKVKLVLTLVVAFWMIPLAYASDTLVYGGYSNWEGETMESVVFLEGGFILAVMVIFIYTVILWINRRD